MVANTTDLEKRLWDAADELRDASEPVLGLMFRRNVGQRFYSPPEPRARQFA